MMTNEVITLDVDDTLLIAQDIMDLGCIRHLPVVDHGRLVGLVTHRDILEASLSTLQDVTREDDEVVKQRVAVKEVMKTDIMTIGRNDQARIACRLMIKHKYGCLPVVDENKKLVGILSEADLLRLLDRMFDS